ncbi:MAG: hypothetical protein ACFBWO_14845 [Paracoccaceae bacterium]
MRTMTATLAALVLAAPMAFAQDNSGTAGGDPQDPGQHQTGADFESMDGDGDGMVSRDEFMAADVDGMDEDAFAEIDSNEDDVLSEEEFGAYDATDLQDATQGDNTE